MQKWTNERIFRSARTDVYTAQKKVVALMPDEKLKILIAEDNPGLARVLAYKFSIAGYEPITCFNGDDAWDAYSLYDVAAVISDQEMPGLSGTDLIERIRTVDSELPCFMVTGRQLELSRDPHVIELNVNQVFSKPFSPGVVLEAVSAAIHGGISKSPLQHPLTEESPSSSNRAVTALGVFG